MNFPFTGTWVWIWEFANCDGGDFDAIAARCKAAGVTGVLVKSADGGRWYNQPYPIWRIVYELQQRGLKVATWDYNYCGPAGEVWYGYAVAGYVAEAQRAVEAITYRPPGVPDYRGPDAHVLDWEAESEGRADNAAYIAKTITDAAPGFPVAFAPLPAIRYHLTLPYRQAVDAGFAMLPQLYFTGLGWSVEKTVSEFYADAAQYQLLAQPIFPAYQDSPGYEASEGQIADFAAQIVMHGATGVSVWSYQHLSDAGWRRLGAFSGVFTPKPPVPEPPKQPTNDDLIQLIRLELAGDYAGARDYLTPFTGDTANVIERATLASARIHRKPRIIPPRDSGGGIEADGSGRHTETS